MTGPEHYREAERLLDKAADLDDYSSPREQFLLQFLLQSAQVHMGLAIAAAIALKDADSGLMPQADENAWVQAASMGAPVGGEGS